MRAAILVIGLALPFCPGCFTLLGAAIDAASGGSGSAGATAGARVDADIAQSVVEGMSSGGESAVVTSGEPGMSAYPMADAYLYSIPGTTGTADDAEVIEARSLASAVEVCAAFNDLSDGGACVCHAIREPVPRAS